MADNLKDPRNPLSYGRKGTARFDVKLAMQQQAREQRELLERLAEVDPEARKKLAILRDMERMGVKGIGDIHTQATEPGQRYYEQTQGPRVVLPELAVTGPPPSASASASASATGAAAGEGVGGGGEAKCCQPTYVVPPLWQNPPLTAITLDLFTRASGVLLPGDYPGPGTPVTIITFVVPDRVVMLIDRFGNELEDFTAWGNVRWSMAVNRRPVRCYGEFDVQLGRFVDPTKLATPVILKHKDEFAIVCRSLDGLDHYAYARIMGWAWMPVGVTQGGKYQDFFVT